MAAYVTVVVAVATDTATDRGVAYIAAMVAVQIVAISGLVGIITGRYAENYIK